MIPAFIDGGRSAAGRLIFRGRGLAFWIERAFPFCSFAGGGGKDGGMAIVFSLDLFPLPGAGGDRSLSGWFRSRSNLRDGLYAPAGKPFFAVSRTFLRQNGLRLEPGLFRSLRAFSGAVEMELKSPVTAIDPAREPLAVEAAVIALQLAHLRRSGVRVENAGNFCLEGLPRIGRGTVVGSGVVLRGECRIGRNVVIYPNCFIENSSLGDNCVLLPGSVIVDSRVEKNVQLGPFCHLRLDSLVRAGAKVGNFVEMKKSVFGQGSKAMHLSYIGDAAIGRRVNIGAGTITCNYDGRKKNPTRIGDDVFIGSGTELVAPVTVESDSYVAAGSTVTEDVPRHALAVARQRQRNIKGWVLRKRKK